MKTRNNDRIDWATISATVTALFTFLWFVWTVSPDQWKVASTITSGAVAIALITGYFLSPRISGQVNKHGRLMLMLFIAILIPFSKFFFIEQSANLFLVSSIEAICIVLIVYASKEWRTIKPVRSKVDEDKLFQWAGIIGDEVGRGPGSKRPDGAPDAVFKLRLREKPGTANRIVLRRLKPSADGYKYTRQIWRTDRHPSNWVLGVVVDNERIEPNQKRELDLHLSEDTEILLYASDHWMPSNWFERGQKYEVEISYRGAEEPVIHTLIIP